VLAAFATGGWQADDPLTPRALCMARINPSLAVVLPAFRGSCQRFSGFTAVATVLAGAGASAGHEAMLLPQPFGGRGHAEDACGLADADRLAQAAEA